MVTGSFYGALAASASIFIGILTALISNRVSQIRSEERRLEARKTQLNRELENLRARHSGVESRLQNIREKRESHAQKEARKNLNDFIAAIEEGQYSTPPELLTTEDVYALFADFLGIEPEELDSGIEQDPHMQELEEREEEIKILLASAAVSEYSEEYDFPTSNFGVPGTTFGDTKDPRQLFIDSYKQNHDIDHLLESSLGELAESFAKNTTSSILPSGMISNYGMDTTPSFTPPREIDSRRYDELSREKEKIEIEIEERSNQIDDVADSLRGLDTSELMIIFYATIITGSLSVMVPIVAFWRDLSGSCLICSPWLTNHWLDIVLVSWILGFVISFLVLYGELKWDLTSH